MCRFVVTDETSAADLVVASMIALCKTDRSIKFRIHTTTDRIFIVFCRFKLLP